MTYRILVTGGAGFIGSFLVDELVKEHDVTILDNLNPQVHRGGNKPDYLNPEAEFVEGDVGDESFAELLKDHEIIYHQAAAVGVGQSMYRVRDYVGDNTYATSNLLQALVSVDHGIKKLVVASSMSIYGEGKYECEECGVVYPRLRSNEQLMRREWEVKCPTCGRALKPLPTDEDKPLYPTSIYAITKRDQEEMCLVIGKAYGIPTVALRYFNVYGPRQALSNPYTGVCAVFSSRIRNNNSPVIYEDGLQTRDFVSVYDIVQANLLALKRNANYGVFNVGTGRPISIRDIADVLIELYGKDMKPVIEGRFREGDIRHCYSDISRIRRLGYKPSVEFASGIKDLVEWVNSRPMDEVEDLFEEAQGELEKRKLLMG
jgi:dTDP-L-rhamnose 4-epimerase